MKQHLATQLVERSARPWRAEHPAVPHRTRLPAAPTKPRVTMSRRNTPQSVVGRSISGEGRRLLMVAVVAVLTTLCFGCSRSQDPQASDGEDSLTNRSNPKQLSEIVVGFAQTGAESPWRIAHGESIEREAKKRNIKLLFADGQNVHNNQINAVNGFITKGVDLIVIAPQESIGWKPTLKEAKRAGIPVVLTSRGVDAPEDLYHTVLVADFVWEGEQAANWLVEKTGGKARIIELVGTPAADVARMRKEGFQKGIAGKPDMKIIASQSGDFNRTKGKSVMEALLEAHKGDIDAVYAHNDDMALGAIGAIEASGLKPGEDIVIVSVDAVKPAFEAMKEGKLNSTVECSPLHGPQLFDTIEKIIKGQPIDKKTIVPGRLFTANQAAALLDKRPY